MTRGRHPNDFARAGGRAVAAALAEGEAQPRPRNPDTVPDALFWQQKHPDGTLTIYWQDKSLRSLDPFTVGRGPHRSATRALQSIQHFDGDAAAELAYTRYYGTPRVSDLATIRVEAAARGFTHVQTHGGPVPVADWTPYGNGIEATWRGEWSAPDAVRDVPRQPFPESALGVWRFLTL